MSDGAHAVEVWASEPGPEGRRELLKSISPAFIPPVVQSFINIQPFSCNLSPENRKHLNIGNRINSAVYIVTKGLF